MKRLIVLLAAMLVSSAASAQLLLGVEGGLSVNNYSKDNGLDCNGWKVGAYVGYTFRSHWQLQSGIGYYGNRMGSVKDWSDSSRSRRRWAYMSDSAIMPRHSLSGILPDRKAKSLNSAVPTAACSPASTWLFGACSCVRHTNWASSTLPRTILPARRATAASRSRSVSRCSDSLIDATMRRLYGFCKSRSWYCLT